VQIYKNKLKVFKKNVKKERVIVYIDGFNLYFGMTSKYKNTKWLDLISLAEDVLKPTQTLVEVRYYTAMISNNVSKVKRQVSYIDALRNSGVLITLGHYKKKQKSCRSCRATWFTHEEKMTDVNISVDLLKHAMEDRYDAAMLISGDSDLVPPIKAVHSSFQKKRVFVVFPPNRANEDVRRVAKGYFTLGRKTLLDNQFAETIQLPNGKELIKPNDWL
tara:strand:+ start:11799 stop:12452 length:654 start_codon:yes stop_codon:yes gene_type:complete